jgi:glycosyltransferase involved in cell wall biosynthesis
MAEHLALYLPHLHQGGAELSMLRLAAGLARGGLRVDLVVHSLADAHISVPANVQVHTLGTGGSLDSLRALAQWLRQHRPRWLLSAFPHSNVTAVAARALAGVRCFCVLTEHAPLRLQISRQPSWRYKLLPPLVRWAYPRADAVVAVSGGVQADLRDMLGPRLRLQTLHNPVLDDGPVNQPHTTTPLHPWLLDTSLSVVLSVSRLSDEKDLPTLLRAFARLHARRPQTRLLLAGEGPARATLQALVAQLQLGAVVALPGRIEGPRSWMQKATVFAMASTYEGFGNTLVEALASGTAVVSTDCPVGPREILAGGRYGSLVPVGDFKAMARALQNAVDNPGAPAAAVAHAAQFSDAAACAAYRHLLDSLLARAAC